MMHLVKHFEHLKLHLEAIKAATNNFADDNCIGRGGFGKVYKGELVHSKGQSLVAFKRLDPRFGQGNPEFWKEISMLSLYKHENIVSLLGFCDESDEKILVYEYASRRSLDMYLNNKDLSWIQRLKICIGAARGLAFLHNPSGTRTQQRVLHRDIKSSNILLDDNWNAKISDMGLSRFGPANQIYTFLVSNTVGTIGYIDPVYVETGLLTKESDVYSLGVVLFEVLCGRLCICNMDGNHQSLIGLVRRCYAQNKISEIVFESVKDIIKPKSLQMFTEIAYQCLKRDVGERPSMADVVQKLEKVLDHEIGPKIHVIVGDCALFKPSNDSPPLVGIIRRLDKEDNQTLSVNWLYPPSEVKLSKESSLKAAENEVFYSFHQDEIPAASLLHPVKVAFLGKGATLPSREYSYVCRRVYDVQSKSLWWLNDQDYHNELQQVVNQLLDKTRIEMYGSRHFPKTFKGKKTEQSSDSGQLRSEDSIKAEIAEITDKGGLVEDEELATAIQESLKINSPPRNNHGSLFPSLPNSFSGVYRICAGCNGEISHGRFLSCMGDVWHPECFRCHACNIPISDYEFSMSENRPFHKSCYKDLYHPICDVCKSIIPTNGAGLIEYRTNPFWLQKYCPAHEHDGTPRCYSCERMEPGYPRYFLLDDGRKLCVECLDSSIMYTYECQPLYLEIQDFYQGLIMKIEQQVPLLLVERQALNEAMEGEKHGHHHMPETRGLCLSEEQTISTIMRPRVGAGRIIDMFTEPYKLVRKCEVTAILILYGLPRLLTGSILAHEMMHAWLRLNGYSNLPPDVEEGICQVLAHMWLDSEIMAGSSGTSVASSSSSSAAPVATSSKKGKRSDFEKQLGEFFKHQIESDMSAACGDGFREGKKAVLRYGLRSTLEHIRFTGRFPC